MFRKIAGTIFTRFLTALLTLAVVILTTNFLGAARVGVISLIILAATIIQMVHGFFGGASLVYFVPRAPLLRLVVPSVVWALVTSVGMSLLLNLFDMIPEEYLLPVMGLSLVQSLSTVTSMVLLGQERIRANNLISLVQFMIMALFLVLVFTLTPRREVGDYVYGLILSYSVAFLIGFILILPRFRHGSPDGTKHLLRSVVTYGAAAQTGNFLQLLNYRLSYYFVKAYAGLASLGVFSVGVQISEGLWIIPRSISLVQFTRISNSDDRNEAVRLTLLFAKISFLITAMMMMVLLLLPSSFFTFVFGAGFLHVRLVLTTLAAGIVMFSLSVAISPYFSGTGRPHINTAAAAIGLLLTLGLGFLLVPRMGIAGAGLTSSISYSVTAIFQLVIFISKEKIPLKSFFLTGEDIRLFMRVIRRGLFIKNPEG
jgi:O-antigen/teichoic acid export membrane protein